MTCAHDWQPDGGTLRFETHPGGELPHVHTTCVACKAQMWWTEWQWPFVSDASRLRAALVAIRWQTGDEWVGDRCTDAIGDGPYNPGSEIVKGDEK